MTVHSAARFVGEKILRIPFHEYEEPYQDRVSRGESIASLSHANAYVEPEPSTADFLRSLVPTRQGLKNYTLALFPFIDWMPRYNGQWLMGDLVAGITVGCVVVPQGMAYAKLAQLPVQFGLYSSFVGVMLYWAFATSKDITIGPVAVMSLIVGNIVLDARDTLPDVPGHVIASALAVIVGAIVLFMGLIRAGFIVDFIPLPAIAAFMTGSALNIAVGQVPALMGITGFSTRDSPYLVAIHILQHLGRSNLNAAMGLTALTMLYIIRFVCNLMARKQPHRQKLWFFIATLRTAFVILLYTMISWLVNRHRRTNLAFATLGDVPRGFQNMGVPVINTTIIKAFASNIPVSVIVLLIEHIGISKSFGRINNYTINPSQELIAIGVTNVFGAFFGAYPATGSFSRTAIKSKAGVRTPLAGVITGIVVLLAIYLLKAVFFYIPNAALSAVIIHAVGDLIVPPKTIYGFWRISPLEVVIFFAGVLVSVFATIEIGIYTTVAASGALLLFRTAKADGAFLGRLQVRPLAGDGTVQNVYLPIGSNEDGYNPAAPIREVHPGVFVFRLRASFLYPNAVHVTDQLTSYIMNVTKRTNPSTYGSVGDRPWNVQGPRKIDPEENAKDPRPTLKAIVIDFSAVRNIDVSSTQTLYDVRKQLDRHAAPEEVEWHFASVSNPWSRRALASVGFGKSSVNSKAVFSVANVTKGDSPLEVSPTKSRAENTEIREADPEDQSGMYRHGVPVTSTDYPAFHLTVDEAVEAALHSIGAVSRSSSHSRLSNEKASPIH